jgi:hypothetical protein
MVKVTDAVAFAPLLGALAKDENEECDEGYSDSGSCSGRFAIFTLTGDAAC